MLKRFAIAVAVLCASACAFTDQRDVAEAEVQRFHRLYNQRQAQALYADASDELKRITQEEDFVRLMTELHDDFGNVRDASRNSWSVDIDNGRTTVKLRYDIVFERGEASEAFTYRIEAGRPILVTYRISSDAAEEPGNTL